MVDVHTLQLNDDNFNFDRTEGFEMAVEKEWHFLDPVDANTNIKLFDSDLKRLPVDNRYGIRIFYKLVLPLSAIPDSGVLTNPLLKTEGGTDKFTFDNCTPIGVPTAITRHSTEEDYRGILITDDLWLNNDAYALPDDSELNHTHIHKKDFATGCDISTLFRQVDTKKYLQPNSYSIAAEAIDSNGFLFAGGEGTDSTGWSGFSISEDTVSYSISTGANRLNLPQGTGDNDLYLQPMLFRPFGMACSVMSGGTPIYAWLYCVLGVKQLYNDPQYYMIRLIDGVDDSIIGRNEVLEGTDISDWVDETIIPEHEGYTFVGWSPTNPAFDVESVNMDQDITFNYELDVEDPVAFVNGDGDIAISNIPYTGTGEAVVTITFAEDITSATDYDSFDVFEFGEGEGSKADATLSQDGLTITFTDEDISSHDFYRIGLYDDQSERIGETAWNEGIIPVSMTITVDGETDTYEIVTE